MISIAIDGPSGAGKSTLSKNLSKKLGFVYVDTGALYRAVGLFVLRAGKNPKEEAEVVRLLLDMQVNLAYESGEQQVFLNGENVSGEIRREDVSMAASDVSAHGGVRAFLLQTQRRLAQENNVVMDGRDIGTVVLPKANLKIFLTATPEDRAQRRYEELLNRGVKAQYETVLADVKKRDYNDTNRSEAPLKKAEDAVEVITTGNSFEKSVQVLYDVIVQNLPELSV